MWPLSLSSHNNSQKKWQNRWIHTKKHRNTSRPQIKQILHSIKPIKDPPLWLKCGASMLTSRMPRGSLCDIHTCIHVKKAWIHVTWFWVIYTYVRLEQCDRVFLTSSSAMVTYTVSKTDHSLFGYIDIDGIFYEIFLIPANHCHVLSLCMSIAVALRLFIVHMNWQPV